MRSVSTTTWLITAEIGTAQPTEAARGQKTRSSKKHPEHSTVQSPGAISCSMKVRLAAISSKTLYTVVGRSGKRRQQAPPAGGQVRVEKCDFYIRAGSLVAAVVFHRHGLSRQWPQENSPSDFRGKQHLLDAVQRYATSPCSGADGRDLKIHQTFAGAAIPGGDTGITAIESAGSPHTGGPGPA